MEVTSILHPTTCGFGRMITYELIILGLPLEERMEKYNVIFEECLESFQVTSQTQRRYFPKIVNTRFSFYKNILYKNIEDEMGKKVKNILRICSS